jgi:3-oxoacyl-(acyl-carrier-protein) synthase
MGSADSYRRVAITGMATINPLGDTLEGYFDNLIQGHSGIKRWTSLDMSQVECKVGGDLGDYDFVAALNCLRLELAPLLYKRITKLFRTATFSNKIAVLCALRAYRDAGLWGQEIDPYRVSTIVGGHNFNSRYVKKNYEQFNAEPLYIDPLFGVEALDPNIAATITEVLGLRGPAFTIGGACASGNLALRSGHRDILSGECDYSLVSGFSRFLGGQAGVSSKSTGRLAAFRPGSLRLRAFAWRRHHPPGGTLPCQETGC